VGAKVAQHVDNVNMMVDTAIDTVISNELKDMASEFMVKVRSMDVFPLPPDMETGTADTNSNDITVTKRQ
jgi:hypothetical protein